VAARLRTGRHDRVALPRRSRSDVLPSRVRMCRLHIGCDFAATSHRIPHQHRVLSHLLRALPPAQLPLPLPLLFARKSGAHQCPSSPLRSALHCSKPSIQCDNCSLQRHLVRKCVGELLRCRSTTCLRHRYGHPAPTQSDP
ncbi:hypothetical protein PENTCL1PPCAC_14133, partial [Pristionchus entomophagus]